MVYPCPRPAELENDIREQVGSQKAAILNQKP